MKLLKRAQQAVLTMSNSGLITITLFAALMIWDGYQVYFGGGVQSSVSVFIITWFGFNPVPFYAGTIVGHLVCNMWPNTTRLTKAYIAYVNQYGFDGSPRATELRDAIAQMTRT